MSKKQNEKRERFETKLQMLGYFMKGSIRYFGFSILFTLIVTLLDMANPRIISFTVDSVIGEKPSTLPTFINRLIDGIGGLPFLKAHLGWIAGIVIAIALVRALFRYLWRYYNAKGAETFVETTRNEIFHHLLALPSSWHSAHHTGDIIQRCTSDIEQSRCFCPSSWPASSALFRRCVLRFSSCIGFMAD